MTEAVRERIASQPEPTPAPSTTPSAPATPVPLPATATGSGPDPGAPAAEPLGNLRAAEQKTPATKAFDAEKADQDLVQLEGRLKDYKKLAKSEFLPRMRQYVQAARNGDDEAAEARMTEAVDILSNLKAFTIGRKVYLKQGEDVDEATLAELSQKAMSNTLVWSKLNKYKAIETVAGGEKGNSLEASAAGSLFDGLTFGMDYVSHKVLQRQWSLVSQSFISHAHGVVHAQVLGGIDKASVLTTTEWPIIKERMGKDRVGADRVDALVVHIFKWTPHRQDPTLPGKLDETAQHTITEPGQWEQLPKVDWSNVADGSKEQQTIAHNGETHRFEHRKRFEEIRAKFATEHARLVTPEPGSS